MASGSMHGQAELAPSGSAPKVAAAAGVAGSSRKRLPAALTIFSSNHMENLADLCAVLMSEYPQSDVFAHEQVVVMNMGMRTFLTQRVAMQNEIASLCDFNQIWQLIYGIYRILHPHSPKKDLYNRDHMTWNLFSILGQLVAEPPKELPEGGVDICLKLRQYLEDDEYGDKAYELAAKIADTLDQYQMYRPEWIKAWNAMPLRVFAEYEQNPKDESNPINIFINDICRKLVRRRSGLKPKAAAAAAAADAASTSEAGGAGGTAASGGGGAAGGGAGISPERMKMVRALFENNIWQIKLWCMLRHNLIFFGEDDRTPLLPDSPELMWQLNHLDRAQVMMSMIEELGAEKLSPAVAALLPERLFIFGVSALPKVVVHFLSALSHYCNINVMLLEPCMDYRGDIMAHSAQDFAAYVKLIQATTKPLRTKNKRFAQRVLALPTEALARQYKQSDYDAITGERVSGNSLLLSLGRQGSDNFRLFYDLEPTPNNTPCFSTPDLVPSDRPYVTTVRENAVGSLGPLHVTEVRGGTLLNYVQRALMHIEQKNERYIIDPLDKSLEIHSCHTKRREVEILHDTILAYFNEAKLRGESLYPRDIVVMVPAINEYTPHISAVFGGAYSEDDPDYIPFVISDMTEHEANTVAQSLLKLLEISTQRVTAAMVIELLSEESIARRFELRPSEVEVLSAWLSEANVYWGLDDADIAEYAEITIPGTFDHGLERMILGTLVGESDRMPCYSEIEGSDSQILGKFWEFLRSLRELRARFTPELSLTPDQWALELQRMLTTRFFADDDNTQNSLQAVLAVIDGLQNTIAHLHHKPRINLPVFAAALRQGLVAQRNFQPFLREKINFCSLMPMRAVPFKHIFILGLNDHDFPREDTVPGFNLMGDHDLFEVGDRSRNMDDRFLFLEAIISARKSLYLSYIGQSPVDKTEQNPSIVLDELIYYICDHCAVEGDTATSDGERQKHVLERIRKVEHLNAYQNENYLVDPQAFAALTASAESADASAAAGAATGEARAAAPAGAAAPAARMVSLPSFNRSFILPSKSKKQDAPMLGAGVFFDENYIKLQLKRIVELSDLFSFLKSPSRFFLRHMLGISFLRTDRVSQEEDESFAFSSFETNLLVREVLKLPVEVRSAYLEHKSSLGELPYGIFGQELVREVTNQVTILTAAMQTTLGISSLCEFEDKPCPKTPWTLLVPKRYFKGEPLPSLRELIAPSLQAASGADAAAALAPAPAAGAAGSGAAEEQVLINGVSEPCYRFNLTLQANYHEQPFVVSTTSVVGQLLKKQGYARAVPDMALAYPAALTKSSLVLEALGEAIAYFLSSGKCKDVLIIDAAGYSYCLKAFSPEHMRYIITALLLFYLLGLVAPFPCCREVLRCLSFAPDSGASASAGGVGVLVPSQDKMAQREYFDFAYDENSVYLYGAVENLRQDIVLSSKAALFLDFYLSEIAPNFEGFKPQP